MLKFNTKTADLKKALSIANLARSEQSDSLSGHSLFQVKDNIKIFSTDKDKIAVTTAPCESVEGAESFVFTADSKKLTSIINLSKSDVISFSFDPDQKTLNVYASENPNSFLSFPTLDAEEFAVSMKNLEDLDNITTLNSGILMAGFSFIQSFLSEDKKDKKFSRLYIDKGVIYGANGSNKVGAFTSPDYKDLDGIIIRGVMLSPLVNLINSLDSSDITIKENDKFIYFTSDSSGFGFLKVTDKMIKFPIELDPPESDSLSLNKNTFLTKINRLAIVGDGDVDLKVKLASNSMEISTLTERSSVEEMAVNRKSGTEEIEFLFKYKIMKTLIAPFQSPELDIYVKPKEFRLITRSEGQMEIEEKSTKEKTLKDFQAVGLIGLATLES